MKKIIYGILATLALALFPAAVSAPAAQAAQPTVASVAVVTAVTNNTVCNSRGSDYRSYFPAYYTNGGDKHIDLHPGRCASNIAGFAVPQGWYCTSPWGYRYEGGFIQVYYPFKTSNNYLVLDCRHA